MMNWKDIRNALGRVVRGKPAELPPTAPTPVAPLITTVIAPPEPLPLIAGDSPMEWYLKQFISYAARTTNVYGNVSGPGAFTPANILAFAPSMGFTEQLQVRVRPLTADQYLESLKKTNPTLAEIIDRTDLKKSLKPQVNIYEGEPWTDPLTAIAAVAPPKDLLAFDATAESIRLIPDLEMLSWVMKRGNRFREYLVKTNQAGIPGQAAIFVYKRIEENEQIKTVVEQHLPATGVLFSPDKVKMYVDATAQHKVRGLIDEYDALVKTAEGEQAEFVGYVADGIRKNHLELYI